MDTVPYYVVGVDPASADGTVVSCCGCHNEIDPDTCYCGDPREGHSWGLGHGFVPMGCTCGRFVTPCP